MTCKNCLSAVAASATLGLLILVAFVLGIGHFLAEDDLASPADALVVLGGDDGNFCRVRHAVDLYHAGQAPLVVFSGGTLANAGLACSSAQLSLEAARDLGLPPGAALIADGAQSTYDEAVNMAKLARGHHWQSLIVVTDRFHTRRVARTFRTLLPGVTVYASAAPDPRYDAARWWQTEDGLVAVFGEVLKLAFYWLKYGITPL